MAHILRVQQSGKPPFLQFKHKEAEVTTRSFYDMDTVLLSNCVIRNEIHLHFPFCLSTGIFHFSFPIFKFPFLIKFKVINDIVNWSHSGFMVQQILIEFFQLNIMSIPQEKFIVIYSIFGILCLSHPVLKHPRLSSPTPTPPETESVGFWMTMPLQVYHADICRLSISILSTDKNIDIYKWLASRDLCSS